MINSTSSNPLITVVVCTYNRAEFLKGALQSLAEQTTDMTQYEVVVVDNNSNDLTKEVVRSFSKQYPNFRYCKELNQGLSHARNRGYKEARGDYVAYIDDDAKADVEWLKYAIKVIEEIQPDIFGGPYYPFYIDEKPEWMKDEYASFFYDRSRFLSDNEYLSGSNIFLKRPLLEDLGGFDPQIGMKGSEISYGEETALIVKARKAQCGIYYSHKMKVYHLVPKYKMNVFWYLLRAFEHGRKADKMFHLSSEYREGELVYDLLNDVMAMFDQIRQCIFSDTTDEDHIENKIKERVSPIAGRLGQIYERYITAYNKHTGKDMYEVLEFIRGKKIRIQEMEKNLDLKIQEVRNSISYRVGRVIISPALLISYLIKKLIRKD